MIYTFFSSFNGHVQNTFLQTKPEENERKIKRIEIRDYSNGKQRLAARKL